MSSILKFSAFLMIIAMTLSTACSKNDPANPTGCANNFNWTVELQAEAQVLSDAAVAYGQDPSTENCNDYKSAFQAYLDAATNISLCVPTADQAAYNQSIADAQASLDALTC